MPILTAKQIPADFEELLKALGVAARVAKPLLIADSAVATALAERGLIRVFGSGFVGSAILSDLMSVAGAVQMISMLCQKPPLAPELPAMAAATAPPPAPSFTPVPAAPEVVPTPPAPVPAAVAAAPPPAPSTFTPAAPPPAAAEKRISLTDSERELLRHGQVLGVHIDALQAELDKLFTGMGARFEEIEDLVQLDDLSRQLPHCALRVRLRQRVESR